MNYSMIFFCIALFNVLFVFGRVIHMKGTQWSREICCVPLLTDLTDTAWVLCLQPITEPCLPVSYASPYLNPSGP